MQVLETSLGLVFESRDGDLLLAGFDPSKHSLTGPIWTVVELDISYTCEEANEPLYSDYATEAGREWRRDYEKRTGRRWL